MAKEKAGKKSTKASSEDEVKPKKKRTKEEKEALAAKKLKKKKKELAVIEETELPENIQLSEKQNYKVYMFLFKRVKRLVKKLDIQSDKGEFVSTRDVYALCTLISSLREIMNDMRQISDSSEHVQKLIQNVFQPYTSNIGQKMLDNFYAQQKLLTNTMKPKEAKNAIEELKMITRESAQYLQQQHNETVAKIEKLFAEG
jgi:hypothetical protein